ELVIGLRRRFQILSRSRRAFEDHQRPRSSGAARFRKTLPRTVDSREIVEPLAESALETVRPASARDRAIREIVSFPRTKRQSTASSRRDQPGAGARLKSVVTVV